MNAAPTDVATTWAAVPLVVVGVPAVARVLNRSERSIARDLAIGRMRPAPLTRRHPRAPHEWAKSALVAHIEGKD